jgi:hypothetical protein
MTIRKNRPPPNVVVPRGRTNTGGKSSKSKGSTSKAGGVSGSGGTSKSTQAKLGTNAYSVDHVDHADPDQKRGRQQFQNTGNTPAAENLSQAAKKAVTTEGKLRRSENKDSGPRRSDKKASTSKSTRSTNIVDDDDGPDGVAMKAAKVAAASAGKVGPATTVKAQKTQKADGSSSSSSKDSGGGKVEGGGKGKGGHARVEKGSSGERLEQNEKVSIAVESSGKGDGAGAVSPDGKSSGGGDLSAETPKDIAKADVGGAVTAAVEVGGAAAVVTAAVELGSEVQAQPEIQRAGEISEVKDAKFDAAIKDVPKGDVIGNAQDSARGTELERPLERVASGQLESDIQDDLHAGAVDAKNPGAVKDTDGPFDDVANSIAEDGSPIDGVLGDDKSRAKGAEKGLPFVKGDGTRRGIDAPVEKSVSDMATATGKAGVDATDIAQDTKKMAGADEDGEGEAEEEEDDGEEE